MKLRIELLTNEEEPIGRRCDVTNLSYFVGMVAYEAIVEKVIDDMSPDPGEADEMSDAEKKRRCDEAYNKSVESPDHPSPSICVVEGREYTFCPTCPLYLER